MKKIRSKIVAPFVKIFKDRKKERNKTKCRGKVELKRNE